MNKNYILALDIGNTKIAGAVFNQTTDQQVEYKRIELPPINNAREHLDEIIKLAKILSSSHKIHAIGVSFGGPVDQNGNVMLSHTIKGWENIDLKLILENNFQCKVIIDNDANSAAFGEYSFGNHNLSDDSMMYITYSTGIGGGFVLNGKLWLGYQGLAGEIGHMLVDPNGPRWWGDRKGAVYRISSGTYIAKRAKRWLDDEPFQGEILRKKVDNKLENITAKIVAQAADEGDKIAWESLQYSAWGLGIAIANTANLLNLKTIVIGGSVIKAGKKFWNHILETAMKNKMPEIEFEILKANLGDQAPIWGGLSKS